MKQYWAQKIYLEKLKMKSMFSYVIDIRNSLNNEEE